MFQLNFTDDSWASSQNSKDQDYKVILDNTGWLDALKDKTWTYQQVIDDREVNKRDVVLKIILKTHYDYDSQV